MTPAGPGSSPGQPVTKPSCPADGTNTGEDGKLVTAAVDYAAQAGLVVVPSCPFAQSWLDRHPDVAARVQLDEPR